MELTNIIETLLILDVLHTALGRDNCYLFTSLMEIFLSTHISSRPVQKSIG